MIQYKLNIFLILPEFFTKLQLGIFDRLSVYLIISFYIISISFTNIIAQDRSIQDMTVYIDHFQLYVTCQFKREFIDENMQQSLSSGMSNAFNFQINLKYDTGSIVRSQLTEVVIRYDIWEKQYLLFSANQIHQFSTYQQFELFLYDSLSFNLGSIRGLNHKKPLGVIVFFSPEKISTSQKEKLNYWLTGNTDTKESAPGLEQESGFSIDLSKLFSLFLSNKPKTSMEQFKTKIFTIENLRKNEKPTK